MVNCWLTQARYQLDRRQGVSQSRSGGLGERKFCCFHRESSHGPSNVQSIWLYWLQVCRLSKALSNKEKLINSLADLVFMTPYYLVGGYQCWYTLKTTHCHKAVHSRYIQSREESSINDKAYGGSRDIAPLILNLGIKYRWVNPGVLLIMSKLKD
jgi:hypothetical protein